MRVVESTITEINYYAFDNTYFGKGEDAKTCCEYYEKHMLNLDEIMKEYVRFEDDSKGFLESLAHQKHGDSLLLLKPIPEELEAFFMIADECVRSSLYPNLKRFYNQIVKPNKSHVNTDYYPKLYIYKLDYDGRSNFYEGFEYQGCSKEIEERISHLENLNSVIKSFTINNKEG